MRKAFVVTALVLGPVSWAHADELPGQAAVADLGRVNGLALACTFPQVAARVKEVMLAQVPKTRAYGEVYEAATSQAYMQIPGGCPDAAALRLEAEVVATRIQAALPAEK
jgi:hypothetical protein